MLFSSLTRLIIAGTYFTPSYMFLVNEPQDSDAQGPMVFHPACLRGDLKAPVKVERVLLLRALVW